MVKHALHLSSVLYIRQTDMAVHLKLVQFMPVGDEKVPLRPAVGEKAARKCDRPDLRGWIE
jgi:hypothetical protein